MSDRKSKCEALSEENAVNDPHIEIFFWFIINSLS